MKIIDQNKTYTSSFISFTRSWSMFDSGLNKFGDSIIQSFLSTNYLFSLMFDLNWFDKIYSTYFCINQNCLDTFGKTF